MRAEHYLKRYCASMAYLLIFGFSSLLYFCQSPPTSIVESIAANSLSNLFIAFYCLLHCIFSYTRSAMKQESASLLLQEVYQGSELQSLDGGPAESTGAESSTPDGGRAFHQLMQSSTSFWYQACSFVFAVFCLSYSIRISNLNASLFLCMGTCAVSFGGKAVFRSEAHAGGGKNHAQLRLMRLGALLLYCICFSIWIYTYPPFSMHDDDFASLSNRGILTPHAIITKSNASSSFRFEANTSSSFRFEANPSSLFQTETAKPNETTRENQHEYFWHNIWFEMVGPFLAPFCMSHFKSQKAHGASIAAPGDEFFLFSLPFLGLMSMTFLSIFLSADHATSDVRRLLSIEDTSSLVLFKSLLNSCMAGPVGLFFSLVIYVGAIGKTEYTSICSSSLSLIFFSCAIFILPESRRNSNITIPCVIMSLLGFSLSLLILIMDVYWRRESQLRDENEISYSVPV